MNKTLLTIVSATIFALCAYAVSDRLDIYKSDKVIKSIMVDEISEITYLPSENEEGFDKINVKTTDGNSQVIDIDELSHIQYSHPTDEFLEIIRTGDEHARVIMLDCINNNGIMDSEKSEDWTAERAGGLPHFITNVDLGYDAVHIITGQYTGKVYTDIPGFVWILEANDDNNQFGQDCWTFEMPNEPVEIKLVSTERSTYDGAAFLGSYTGYPVTVGENRIYKSGEETVFSLEVKGNETYTIKTSDLNNYSFTDLYTYNEANNSFEYQVIEKERLDYQENYTYGAIGNFYGENDVLIDIHNRTIDKSENIRRYFGSKANVDYTCAAFDQYGYQYLIEVTDKGSNTTRWYFLDNYGYIKKEASLEFITGNSISSKCEAKVSYDNELRFKYVLEDGQYPQYIAKGKEAGSYVSADGTNSETLILDGFGEAKIGGIIYSYSIESGIVTIVANGIIRMFLLDFDEKTYTETQSDAWDGATIYINESALGAYYNNGEVNTRNRISISFDQNLIGNEKIGYAAISVDLYKNPGLSNGVADCQRYIYMKDSKILILTNVLTGSESGKTGRKNIIFTVSDDKTALYIAGEGEEAKIYSTTGGYVVADFNNKLIGEVKQQVELANKYTATAKFDYYGSKGDAEVTLNLNADINGNAKDGYATFKATGMGAEIISGCVEFTYENNTLTLKGMTVGDGNYGTTTADIILTVNEDGTLTGSGEYYGSSMMTAFMKLILTDVLFTELIE